MARSSPLANGVEQAIAPRHGDVRRHHDGDHGDARAQLTRVRDEESGRAIGAAFVDGA